MNFHPAEYIRDELMKREWNTWRVVETGGGLPADALALDLFMSCASKSVILDDGLIDILARGFGVSRAFFFRLQEAWLSHPDAAEPFTVPEHILCGDECLANRNADG